MAINIECLIEEVEKRPALYNTGMTEYQDRNKKKTLWEEICLSLNFNWATYSEIEKTIFCKEVQKKWNSLRDCFRRDLVCQFNPAPSGGKKKVKYRYFDKLLFLEPFTLVKISESSLDNQNTESATQSNRNETQENIPKPVKRRNTDCNEDILSVVIQEDNNLMEESNVKIQEIDITTSDDIDDDKLFLLSLLPSFKNCTMEEKYALRIDIMKTILTFKQSREETRRLNSVPTGYSTISVKPEIT